MKYLLLFCVEDRVRKDVSKDEADAIRAESDACDEGLRKSGHLVEEALSIAYRSPLARIGSVEVRPGPPANAIFKKNAAGS